MRNVTDDESIYDENGVIKDGCGLRVRMNMMDGVQKMTTSPIRAQGAQTKMTNTVDPRDAAFEELQLRDQSAWKTKAKAPPPIVPSSYTEQAARQGVPVEKSLGELKPNFYAAHPPGDRTGVNRPRDTLRKTDARDAAYAEQGQRLRDAWKYPNAARRVA